MADRFKPSSMGVLVVLTSLALVLSGLFGLVWIKKNERRATGPSIEGDGGRTETAARPQE